MRNVGVCRLATLGPDGEPVIDTAQFSDCGTYRYSLTRHIPQAIRWVKPCVFVMLNPSTADAATNDPTIRRCIGFAKDWGCTELTVVNLFALRATDPNALHSVADPVGPENYRRICDIVIQNPHGIIVAAWGAHKLAKITDQTSQAILDIRSLLQSFNLQCLGTNKDGSPKHPLYVPKNAKLECYR